MSDGTDLDQYRDMGLGRTPSRKRTALISVFNKDGIVEFAKGLVDLGWNIIASGGTKKKLAEAGVPVRDVAELTGGGAILGHRVVTLSREVFAGILANLDKPEDLAELEQLKIPVIDLVCVDMYPLDAEIAKPEATMASVIEQTDIGGPSMLRAAAKARRIVLCDAADRIKVLAWIKAGEPEREWRLPWLAAKAEKTVAEYCDVSARYTYNTMVMMYHGMAEF